MRLALWPHLLDPLLAVGISESSGNYVQALGARVAGEGRLLRLGPTPLAVHGLSCKETHSEGEKRGNRVKIIGSTVDIVRLPLTTPFRTALRQISTVQEIRVTIRTDSGLQGVGSAAPTARVTGDTLGAIQSAVTEYILPHLAEGVDLRQHHRAFAVIEKALVHNTAAKAAVDIAVHDVLARSLDQPLVEWLGGSRCALTTDATVSLDAPEMMASQAGELLEQGFATLKVKLGGRDGRDPERIEAVREKVGVQTRLLVDANQAWTVREVLDYEPTLIACQVQWLEQPVEARDIDGLAEVSRRGRLPVIADESVYGIDDLLAVIQRRAADMVNIKLMKTGGLYVAMVLAALARARGIKIMVGSMMEGIASVTAAAALAAAVDADHLDLDAGYFLQSSLVKGGIRYQGPRIELPDGPGLGTSFVVAEKGSA